MLSPACLRAAAGVAYDGPVQTLCRDCRHHPPAGADTCPACGSLRILRHPELHDLAIAHLDCDAFYAAIEKRDRPELRDAPVIVGGRHRGVVAACCYIARTYGVRSAMPMARALKRCPDAVVIRPDMKKYAAVGRTVRRMMLELTPLVEPLSIDEAFLDLTGTEALHRASPAGSLAGLARRVEEELAITVSVGLSYNKFLAKIASDLDKPRGFAVIGRAEARSFLAGKPVGLLWGVTLKLKTGDFRIVTRTRRLGGATHSAEEMYRAAEPLLLREADGRAFRLIGIGMHDLVESDSRDDFLGQLAPGEGKIDKAMDAVRDRFGEDAIVKGRGFGTKLVRQGPSKVE